MRLITAFSFKMFGFLMEKRYYCSNKFNHASRKQQYQPPKSCRLFRASQRKKPSAGNRPKISSNIIIILFL